MGELTMAIAAVLALIWALLGDDLKAWSPKIAERLIRHSAERLPAPFNQRFREKWLQELKELPEGAVWSRIALAVIKYLSLAPHLDDTLSTKEPRRQIASFDTKLLYTMRTRGHGVRRETVAIAATKAGNNGLVWLLINLILAAIDPEHREAWLIAAVLVPASIFFAYVLRLLIRRPRPVLEGLPPIGAAPNSLALPSAHAFSSFAVAVTMIRIDPATSFALLIAVGISLSRPYLGLNRPSDVLAGAMLGGALGLIVPVSL